MTTRSFVVDANILFATLLKDGATRRILVKSGWAFAIPATYYEELTRNLADLSRRLLVSSEELQEFMERIRKEASIEIVAEGTFLDAIVSAKQYTPHTKDVPYLALAYAREWPLWTNDKKLKQQKRVKVYNTEEIKRLLEND